jgi:ABC-2 type transport system ATP-binding protein
MTTPLNKSQPAALEVLGLYKRFDGTIAVDHIDLSVPHSSFFGLVGLNGAGKTTTLSMSVGLLRPDGGSASIFGIDVWDDPVEAKALFGVLPDGLSLPERLTGREVLTFLGLLRGLDETTVAQRAQELLEILDLTGAESTLVINYSTGMRKKIALATALLHGPRLLVLDEPFEAIDPVSAANIQFILKRFVANGGSVIFSSHVMATVEQLCDSLAVLHQGRVIAAGSLDVVRAGLSLEERFIALVGARIGSQEGLTWLAP